MSHRLYACISALALSVSCVAVAQKPAATPSLVPPAGLVYRYWPFSLIQFVGAELPYSLITIYVDDRGSAPLYDVTLTSRDGKRMHYVNNAERALEDKADGDGAMLTGIGFDRSGDFGPGTVYTTRFTNDKGLPVLWQFQQMTDVSEQGSGLTELKSPAPYLLYRELGALAGPGTALKVGNVVSNATLWEDIASPPFFMPYRGALSQGIHAISMHSGNTRWSGAQPATLTDGASWTLSSDTGARLVARTAKGATETTFVSPTHKTVMTLVTQPGPGGQSINRIDLGPDAAKPEHFVHLTFSPSFAEDAGSRFDMTLGKKVKLANGNVTRTTKGKTESVTWTLTAPKWAANETATATVQ